MSAAAPAPPPNAFGLHQCVFLSLAGPLSLYTLHCACANVGVFNHDVYRVCRYDGLSSFFGDQSFDYNGFVLPPVRLSLQSPGHSVTIVMGFLGTLSGKSYVEAAHLGSYPGNASAQDYGQDA